MAVSHGSCTDRSNAKYRSPKHFHGADRFLSLSVILLSCVLKDASTADTGCILCTVVSLSARGRWLFPVDDLSSRLSERKLLSAKSLDIDYFSRSTERFVCIELRGHCSASTSTSVDARPAPFVIEILVTIVKHGISERICDDEKHMDC